MIWLGKVVMVKLDAITFVAIVLLLLECRRALAVNAKTGMQFPRDISHVCILFGSIGGTLPWAILC